MKFVMGRGLLLWAVIHLCGACTTLPPETLALVGRPVPDGRLMLLDGEIRALKEAKGRGRAILFWATWCKHSRSAISDFEDLARTYPNRRQIEFFAVNLDRNEDLHVVKGRIDAQDLSTVVHVFSGNDVLDEAYGALKGQHVPYSVFVDEQDIVRYVGIGVGGLEDFVEGYFSR